MIISGRLPAQNTLNSRVYNTKNILSVIFIGQDIFNIQKQKV